MRDAFRASALAELLAFVLCAVWLAGAGLGARDAEALPWLAEPLAEAQEDTLERDDDTETAAHRPQLRGKRTVRAFLDRVVAHDEQGTGAGAVAVLRALDHQVTSFVALPGGPAAGSARLHLARTTLASIRPRAPTSIG